MSRKQVTQISRIIVATMLIAAVTTAVLSYLSYGLLRSTDEKYKSEVGFYRRNVMHVFALQRHDALFGVIKSYNSFLTSHSPQDSATFHATVKDTRTLLDLMKRDAQTKEDEVDYTTISTFLDHYEQKLQQLENTPLPNPLTADYLNRQSVDNKDLIITLERLEDRWQDRVNDITENMREGLSSSRLYLEAQIVVVPILLLLFMIVAFFVRSAARAFRALSDSRARYRALIDISGDPIISINEEDQVITFNKGAEHTFGYDANEVLGQHVNILIPHRYRERHGILLEKFASSSGKTVSMGDWRRVTGLKKDGSEFPFMSSISKIDDGQRVVMTLMMRDMSQVQAREAELEESYEKAMAANQAKSMFLAMISHELRTPMNAITGFCTLLQRSELPSKETEYVGYIDSASQNLLRIINDILDHVKLETGNMELLLVEMSAKEVAESVFHMLEPLAQQKNIGLEIQIDESIPEIFLGDRGRLRQILTNLIGNAIKFTDTGKVTIALSNQDVNDGRMWVRFRITDTGIGIPEDKIDTIFESFFQVNDPMQFRSGGTGLGLTISRNFVQLMGGTINVSSQVGEGSTFDVLLPFTLTKKSILPADSKNKKDGETGRHIPALTRSLNVLLAEDNALNQKLFTTLLENMGHMTTIANNGREAVDAITKQAFDVILMDISMPEMDGVEATKIIRAMTGKASQTPIIALTAHSNLDDPKFMKEIGLNAFVTKPATEESIQAALAKVLG